ncbi:TPA: DUF1499 domain-containing protein [Aeromonas hydrophila]|uniref:DUF1499 domain-containing protein n=1 Tax=Aeromonas TaxID=642 RepID=UPI00090C622F|nr:MULTISPECIES: DUF1499 domain-containing protein [Aeromonas]HEB4994062.1 DUF1499 domain-containing protein [Aeromonas hydrophila subsp. hydrophila]APJ14778.1 hypothetical protein BOQ57_07500 [Aeromonas hydrophila]MCK0185226.1 DUF1499 domain-containing protein [Aeromonas hydrophila]UCM56194.1 DUF1499 domain-containing protein [Aeromonas hydrophila]UOV90614.1 DUF1499 domain-containing protein [Aeromonas hydrophila]
MPRYLWWPLLAWLLPLAGALGSRVHLWPWWLGFAICLLGALVSLVLLIRLPWSRSRCANGWGAAPLLLPLAFVVQALRTPLVNDVSTDPNNPPQLHWAGELRTAQDLPINPAPLKASEGKPGPLFTSASPVEVITEAHALMEQLGWQVRPSPEGLEAVVTTGWFGFQDDVALRVFAGPKETRIDMRSASRQGQSDLGTNRARIEEFLIRLNERLGQAYKPNLKQ